MMAAFRTPTEYMIPLAPHVGFHKVCPQCGAKPYKCERNDHDKIYTNINQEYYHCSYFDDYKHTTTRYRFIRAPHLAFDKGTNQLRYCSPENRVRYGFLWLKKCNEIGVHVHQKCQRCNWHGIAMIEKGE